MLAGVGVQAASNSVAMFIAARATGTEPVRYFLCRADIHVRSRSWPDYVHECGTITLG